MISYFLSNISAKNYGNRIVYVKIIASQRWGVFETRCIQMPYNCIQLNQMIEQLTDKMYSHLTASHYSSYRVHQRQPGTKAAQN